MNLIRHLCCTGPIVSVAFAAGVSLAKSIVRGDQFLAIAAVIVCWPAIEILLWISHAWKRATKRAIA